MGPTCVRLCPLQAWAPQFANSCFPHVVWDPPPFSKRRDGRKERSPVQHVEDGNRQIEKPKPTTNTATYARAAMGIPLGWCRCGPATNAHHHHQPPVSCSGLARGQGCLHLATRMGGQAHQTNLPSCEIEGRVYFRFAFEVLFLGGVWVNPSMSDIPVVGPTFPPISPS